MKRLMGQLLASVSSATKRSGSRHWQSAQNKSQNAVSAANHDQSEDQHVAP